MKKMTIALALTAALGISTTTAIAQDSSEGRDLAELAFASVDSADRGYIDMGEFNNFGGDVFVSMDSDDSGKLALVEFMNWGFGMEALAEERGQERAVETAKRVVFAFWDRNGDGEISRTEHRQSLVADFQRADLNGDATLTKDEFLNGFSMNIAMRAALAPAE